MTQRTKTNLLALALALVLIATSAYILGVVHRSATGLPRIAQTGTPPDSGRLSPFGRGGPMGNGPLFNEQEREKLATEIGLSDEQKEKVAAIFAGAQAGSMEERFEKMRAALKVLTPSQQLKAATLLPGRIEQRLELRKQQAKQLLSPEEYQAFERKLEKVRRNIMEGKPPYPGMPAPPFPLLPPGEGS